MEINDNYQKQKSQFMENNKSPVYLETNPNKIILIKIIDQNFYEGRILMKNVTNNYIIYKFIFNQQMIYSITPSVYFLKPGENFTVNVKRFEKVSIDELKSKDKFLLIAIETPNEIADVNI